MKIEINVPDTLNEITLGQYQNFEKVNTEENKDTAFLLQKMVQIFCNLNLKDVATIKYKSVQEIALHLNKVFDTKHNLIPTFELGGVKLGFIPVLDDMTLGEYIDLDGNLGNWQTMHKAMSILYRPVTFSKGHKYQIEEYKGIVNDEAMKQAPLDVVFSAMVFFYHLSNELTQTILNFLQKETNKKLTTQQKQTLGLSGDGINPYMDSLKKMLPSLTQSLN
tara:strand:+ start:642 stop:1304 length:663 start_codon:yes stop_codon:yes gene_type:complete